MNYIEATIDRKTQLTAKVTEFVLKPQGDDVNMVNLEPGAHIDVKSADYVRQYSLVLDGEFTDKLKISILHDDNGRGGSKHFTSALEVGESVQISLPRNNFKLNIQAENYCLIAGGIGITPIYSMAKYLKETDKNFSLHFCARDPFQAPYYFDLNASELAQNVFSYFDEVDSPNPLDIDALLSDLDRSTEIYVCGPPGLINAVLDKAAAHGWDDKFLNSELFGAAPQRDSQASNSFIVKLNSSNESYTVSETESIASVLNAHGVFIPTSCETGVCGTCTAKILSGEVEHLDCVLSDDEKQNQGLLTTCCSRAKGDTLLLDL